MFEAKAYNPSLTLCIYVGIFAVDYLHSFPEDQHGVCLFYYE